MQRTTFILGYLLIVILLSSSNQSDNRLKRKDKSSVDKPLILGLINAYRASGRVFGSEGNFATVTPVAWNDTLELAAKKHKFIVSVSAIPY